MNPNISETIALSLKKVDITRHVTLLPWWIPDLLTCWLGSHTRGNFWLGTATWIVYKSHPPPWHVSLHTPFRRPRELRTIIVSWALLSQPYTVWRCGFLCCAFFLCWFLWAQLTPSFLVGFRASSTASSVFYLNPAAQETAGMLEIVLLWLPATTSLSLQSNTTNSKCAAARPTQLERPRTRLS